MTNAYVLMTALPPTKGHLNLVEFAADLAHAEGGQAYVIVTTQPDEPFATERFLAVKGAFKDNPAVVVDHLHATLEQNPQAPLFWDMWREQMLYYGVSPGDFIVTSEPYGKTLAAVVDGVFMPYDPKRELYYTKATSIREDPAKYFGDVAPLFQPYLRQTVTVFGAESTGKTTLSKALSYAANGHWLFEWARPYLETAGKEINLASMTAIWRGQAAIQKHGQRMLDKPWVVQDTDLFSTVGYWELPEWRAKLGPVPSGLIKDAVALKSDLYLITRSNIPFEKDPLRYKSEEGIREGSDAFWIDIAEKYQLPYKVIAADDQEHRLGQAMDFMAEQFDRKARRITYDRGHNV